MSIHKPYDRSFYVTGGSVMTDGFSLNLAEGQFGIFNTNRVAPGKGSVAVNSFVGENKRNTLFELKLGNGMKPSRTNFAASFSSFPFKLQDVMDLKVSTAVRTEIGVDDLVIGYDGINPETSLFLHPKENKELAIEFTGKLIEFLGVPDGRLLLHVPLMQFQKECGIDCGEDCEGKDCKCGKVDFLPVLKYAIDYIKKFRFRGDMKVEDFAEVTPIIEHPGIEKGGKFIQVKYCMSVCDRGGKSALAAVQAQYPGHKVVLKDRKGAISTYEITMKGKEEDEVPAIPEDFVVTLPSIIKGCEECPEGYNAVEGGFVYAVILEDDGADLSSVVESLENAVGGTAIKADGQDFGKGMYTVVLSEKLSDEDRKTFIDANSTATVDFVNKVSAICTNDETFTASWSECGRCTFSEESYKLILPDTECGESRLAELQAFYPDLEIVETGKAGGCNREYCTTTFTNVVCDECDPMYVDIFASEAPIPFEGVKWVKDEVEIDGKEGFYGIRIRGKVLKVATGECLRDKIGFVEDSVRIRATGGYVTDTNWGTTGGRMCDRPFNVYYRSHYEPRTHVYGNDLAEEIASNTFFTGRMFNYDYVGRILTGTESNIFDLDGQYVDYALTLRRRVYSQALSKQNEEFITYHIKVDVGRHQEVEKLLNALAAANGIEGVKALPTV